MSRFAKMIMKCTFPYLGTIGYIYKNQRNEFWYSPKSPMMVLYKTQCLEDTMRLCKENEGSSIQFIRL